jgi:hypothetical protein
MCNSVLHCVAVCCYVQYHWRGTLTGSLARKLDRFSCCACSSPPGVALVGKNYSKATIFVNLLVPPKRTCISEWVHRVSPLAATGILRRPRTPASVADTFWINVLTFLLKRDSNYEGPTNSHGSTHLCICRVKITFALFHRIIVSNDKFDDMPCKLDSTSSVSFTEIPRRIV